MKKVLVLMSMLLMSTMSHAQIPTTDIASLIQRVVMIASEAEQLSELVTQVEETQNVVEQTTNTANSLQDKLGTSLTIDQQHAVVELLEQVRQENAVAAGSAGTVEKIKDSYTLEGPSSTFEKSYKATTATNRQAAASNAGVLDTLPTDAARLNNLVEQSNKASGALAATQAGNQINAELAGQLMSLRQQLALQGQAQAADQEMRAKEAAAQAVINRHFLGGKLK